jgi:thiamine transporter
LNTVDPWNLNQVILAEGRRLNKLNHPKRPNQITCARLGNTRNFAHDLGNGESRARILGIVWKPKAAQATHTGKKAFPTRVLAEIITFVSLAAVLSLVSHSFFSLPQGGSINIGMIPIFWLALRRGPKIGIFAGAVFGVVDLAIEPFVVNPIQFILDYPLAFSALGLAGFFQRWRVFGPVVGVVVGGTGRFLSHFVSGIVYFASYAPPGQSPAVYSLIYNGAYMFPSIIICAIVIFSLQASKSLDIYM